MRKEIVWVWLVGVAVVAGGCGISKEVYQRDVDALKIQLADLELQKEGLVNDRHRCTDELQLLSKERGALSADLRTALDRVEEMRVLAEKRKAALANFRAKLQDMVAAGKLTVRTDKGRMIVEMSEKVLFDVGKSKLKEEGLAALTQLTVILVSLDPNRQFQVAGHTDDTGSDETNWRLSLDRAREVVLFMIEEGMPAERISAAGYGRFVPVADNATPDGRALNRRIEIALVPNIEELMMPGGE